MSKGILIFAFNNEEIDYLKIANANKLMIEYNMDVPVHIISTATEKVPIAKRHYSDYNKVMSFNNSERWNAFDLSPFDETIVLDADYLIMNNRYNAVWNNVQSIMINTQIKPLYEGEFIENDRLNDFGINMAWATAIYFQKTEAAKNFFQIMKHVHDNYTYYRQVYELQGDLYRNDFSASIARHMLNGFTEHAISDIPPLPIKQIVTAKPEDEIVQFNGINKVKVKITKPNQPNECIVNSIKNTNIHFLNKKTILDNYESIVELYS